MASATTYIDGDYTLAQAVGAPRYVYPFRKNGDRATAYFEQDYWQLQANWTPQELGTPHDTLKDFYLIAESKPVQFMSTLYAFTRTWSRIPAQQTVYSSQTITKPNPSTLGTAENYGQSYVSSDITYSNLGTPYVYLNYTWLNNQVYSRNSASPTVAPATSGTFTVTYKGNTTAALGYNAADATIAAAINGLASIIADGITVTASNALGTAGVAWIVLDCTVGTWQARCTFNAGSLGPAAAQTGFAFTQYATRQYLLIGWRVPITAHGFSASANLLFSYTSGSVVYEILLAPTNHWSVVDANTIAVGPLYLLSGTTPTVFGTLARAYTPGTDRVGTKLVQSFYLPKVTSGITTAGDITIPNPLLNDAEFLAAVVAYTTGYQTYDSSALTQWMDSPIYTQTSVQINMADV